MLLLPCCCCWEAHWLPHRFPPLPGDACTCRPTSLSTLHLARPQLLQQPGQKTTKGPPPQPLTLLVLHNRRVVSFSAWPSFPGPASLTTRKPLSASFQKRSDSRQWTKAVKRECEKLSMRASHRRACSPKAVCSSFVEHSAKPCPDPLQLSCAHSCTIRGRRRPAGCMPATLEDLAWTRGKVFVPDGGVEAYLQLCCRPSWPWVVFHETSCR